MLNRFRMIDVGAKPVTCRRAAASGEIIVGVSAFALIRDCRLPKGDVLALAEAAGIAGAKKAYDMIPLCHPIGLDHVQIFMELNEQKSSVTVFCFASSHARTGVEMEALAGVNAALLTIWDLTKMVEPDLRMENIRLLAKFGGKKGVWLNPAGVPDWVMEAIQPAPEPVLSGRSAVVLTMSDRAHKGEYEDKSGAVLKDILTRYGAVIASYRVIPDEADAIRATVQENIKVHAPALIVCTGGTGVARRDVTPEAFAGLFDREIPGVGELLRNDGAKYTALSWSSRAIAGVIGDTLVITLPGNPAAVKEGMDALLPALIPHLIRIIRGEKQ